MSDPLCVVATGAYTAVGMSSVATAAAVRSGIAGFRQHPTFTDMLDDPLICAAPPGDSPTVVVGRLIALLRNALVDALDGITPRAREGFRRGSLLVAVPEERPGLPSGLANLTADRLLRELAGGPHPIVRELGHAGGGIALASAREMLQRQGTDWLAIAGVDSYLSRETLLWLDWKRQLHATYNAWGFIPGEAAGVVLLSTLGGARATGLRPLAVVESIGLDHEEVPIGVDGVCLGRGLTRAVRTALAKLSDDDKIDDIYCDQNGQNYRADEMGFMLARLSNRFRDAAAFVAPADCWGDVGAATVPLLVGLVTKAALRGWATGPLSLVFAGSDSGRRAAVLLRTTTGAD
jgi:3-oxoacyl-[acyl-carrier-protein] synthase I